MDADVDVDWRCVDCGGSCRNYDILGSDDHAYARRMCGRCSLQRQQDDDDDDDDDYKEGKDERRHSTVWAEEYQSADCFTVCDAVWEKWKGFLWSFHPLFLNTATNHGQRGHAKRSQQQLDISHSYFRSLTQQNRSRRPSPHFRVRNTH